MTRIALIAALGAACLAGCSGETGRQEGEAVAVGDAARDVEAQGLKPQPGLYKTTITMTGLEIPGLPAGMEGHGAGLARTLESCLTPAEVDKGFAELVKQGQDGECSYEKFDLAGGAIDAVMVCNAEGRTARMEMTGTTTPTSADLEASMAMEFDGAGKGTMRFTAQHQRVGDCPAG